MGKQYNSVYCGQVYASNDVIGERRPKATVRRAFIWEAENWRTVKTLQRPTESQPEEV